MTDTGFSDLERMAIAAARGCVKRQQTVLSSDAEILLAIIDRLSSSGGAVITNAMLEAGSDYLTRCVSADEAISAEELKDALDLMGLRASQ